MTDQEMVIKLGELFKDRFMISKEVDVNDESKLGEDLGFDSLDTVEVSMVIEDEYGVVVDDFSQIGRMITLAKAVNERL